MKIALALPLLALNLAGCAGMATTTREMQLNVEHRYVGQPADTFFRNNGLPSAAMRTQAGGTLYEWRSDMLVRQMPTTTTVNMIGNTAHATTTGGGIQTQFCAVSLEADQTGKIVTVRITGDTIGQWALSRCAEVLRQ